MAKRSRLRVRAGIASTLLACGAGSLLFAGGASSAVPTAASGSVLAQTGQRSLHNTASLHITARARAAGALKATDSAHLHYISASGSLLYEEGAAVGTLPGSMRVHFNVGATLSGSFTIYTRGGTITGHGSATPHGSGVYESFAGSLVVAGGSGHYAHAHGKAGLYGTFNRNNYALVVQTVGTLHY
ncbi:MAG TPA: hypothetical protein VK730_02365 [Solirubrobacteraceae bacterium]|jgi:hypothetical protein|nr:hypothetical protein [Solirubrobacteraceae bacterium]